MTLDPSSLKVDVPMPVEKAIGLMEVGTPPSVRANGEPKTRRIPIMMSASEVKAIDDWRFANNISTRAEAVRRLCQVALIEGPKGFFERSGP